MQIKTQIDGVVYIGEIEYPISCCGSCVRVKLISPIVGYTEHFNLFNDELTKINTPIEDICEKLIKDFICNNYGNLR